MEKEGLKAVAGDSVGMGRSDVAAVEKLLGRSEDRRRAFEGQSDVLEAAALIRDMRERAGISQEELAMRLGTHQSHISELERGNGRQGPTFAMLRRIARACNDPFAIVRQNEWDSLNREIETARKEIALLRERNDRLERKAKMRPLPSAEVIPSDHVAWMHKVRAYKTIQEANELYAAFEQLADTRRHYRKATSILEKIERFDRMKQKMRSIAEIAELGRAIAQTEASAQLPNDRVAKYLEAVTWDSQRYLEEILSVRKKSDEFAATKNFYETLRSRIKEEDIAKHARRSKPHSVYDQAAASLLIRWLVVGNER